MTWKQLKKRLKDPVFLAALTSVVYQVLVKYGKAPTLEEWQMWVDLVTYVVIGVGVFHSFEPKPPAKKQKAETTEQK